MPIYEYKCEGCNEVFEVRQKFSDEPITVHEKCGGKVHRLISPPAFQFKGSGWYVTDYARSGSSSKGDSDAKSSSDTATKTETKSTESKSTETKAADKPAKSE